MPPMNLAPWREAARKLAQAVKRQIEQTEQEVAAFLRPGKQVLQRERVPLPRRSQGTLHDRVRDKQAQDARRHYTQFAGPTRHHHAGRSTSATVAQVKTIFGQSATRSTMGGTLRAHGYRRGFASSSINHAQVVREVFESISLGLRAGVLNNPFFTAPDGRELRGGRVVAGLKASEHLTTVLTIPLTPKILAPSTGVLNAALISAVDEAVLAAPKHLAKLRRNVYRLMQFGSFPYKLVDNDSTMEVVFPGRDRESVELFLDDLMDGKGASLGALHERPRFVESEQMDQEVDWATHLYARDHKMTRSQLSLERYIHDLDVFRACQAAC
ncbi:hypothetical protein BCR37DRAFT_113929 [Protomyces lactucae-debilis]|uniref:Uncharacterized protein n=1 Tax=Protomyces lactucae-debilis TaxID=2754530 RepID=A0A1Y2F3R3_PROLT|nr:uncharacterized protein BCR37DRAFT_113929 [Protomyces lactucae-debilis]ORY78134.1 hypothetical protein BCR37DRAFT_113929 [Protomyces lactucae-debilis]